MKEKLKRTEVWFKLVLFVFFGSLYLLAFPFPEKSRQFPQLISSATLVVIVISLILDFKKKDEREKEIAGADDAELTTIDETTKRVRTKRFLKAWGIILVSVAFGFLGGFLVSTFSFLLGFALFFGKKENLFKNIAIALGITIATYVVFEIFMEVPLLEGILW
jgi:hypothetical protein